MDTATRKYGWIGLGMVLALVLAGLPGAVRGDAARDHEALIRVLVDLKDELKNLRGELARSREQGSRDLDRLADETSRINDAIRSCAGCRR